MSTSSQLLGRLAPVDLREIWLSEASGFTPWLAADENLSVLADTIGVELELEAQEKSVGPFRADILCKDLDTGNWVLIENQLERTDHTHLGQLLTYAAGLQAVSIVWISARFTEEHRATLDWLNDITDERFQFFGLEIELWRIGESPPAPKFNIVAKPNDWSRSVTRSAKAIDSAATSDIQALYVRYWMALNEHMEAAHSRFRIKRFQPHNWYSFSIGRARFNLVVTIPAQKKRLGVEMYITDEEPKALYHLLKEQRPEIETECEEELEWQEMPGKKGSRVVSYWQDADPATETKWPQQHRWIVEKLEKLDRVLRPRIKLLDASDWNPDEEL